MTYEKPVAEVFILGQEDILVISNAVHDPSDKNWSGLTPLV